MTINQGAEEKSQSVWGHKKWLLWNAGKVVVLGSVFKKRDEKEREKQVNLEQSLKLCTFD